MCIHIHIYIYIYIHIYVYIYIHCDARDRTGPEPLLSRGRPSHSAWSGRL